MLPTLTEKQKTKKKRTNRNCTLEGKKDIIPTPDTKVIFNIERIILQRWQGRKKKKKHVTNGKKNEFTKDELYRIQDILDTAPGETYKSMPRGSFSFTPAEIGRMDSPQVLPQVSHLRNLSLVVN